MSPPRRLRSFPSPGQHNSLWYWPEVKPRWKVARNLVLMRAARVWPSMEGRIRLLRRMGAKVGDHVSWGLEATMDVLVPELITIGDESIIGYGTLILGHEFLQREYRLGEVNIGKRVMIGAGSIVLPGVSIADDSVVGAGSVVNRDVDGFTAGTPARAVRR